MKASPPTPRHATHEGDLLITVLSPRHLHTHPELLDSRAVLGSSFSKACVLCHDAPDASPTAAPSICEDARIAMGTAQRRLGKR